MLYRRASECRPNSVFRDEGEQTGGIKAAMGLGEEELEDMVKEASIFKAFVCCSCTLVYY